MKITLQRFTCKCGHVYNAELVIEAPINVVIASMNAMRCPECGGGSEKQVFGGEHPQPDNLMSFTVEHRAEWWWSHGNTGISSMTIWCAFCGGPSPHRRFDVPHDSDDYSRCRTLLDLIPEWRQSLETVSKRFPFWKQFVDRWAEFDKLWDEESPKGRCPKLYALIKVAETEAAKLTEAV